MNSAVFSTFAIVALLSFGYIQCQTCILNTVVAPTVAQVFSIKASNAGTATDAPGASPVGTANPVVAAPSACPFLAAPFVGITSTVATAIDNIVDTADPVANIVTFACNGQYATTSLAAMCYQAVDSALATAAAPKVAVVMNTVGAATGKVIYYMYRFSPTGTNLTGVIAYPATGGLVTTAVSIPTADLTTAFNQFCAQAADAPTLTTNYTSATLNSTTMINAMVQGDIAVAGPTGPIAASLMAYDVTTGMYCKTFTAGTFPTASSATQFTVSSTVSAMMLMLLAVLGN